MPLRRKLLCMVDWTFFHRMSNMLAISSKSLGMIWAEDVVFPLKYDIHSIVRYFPLSPFWITATNIDASLLIHSASLFSGHIRHTPKQWYGILLEYAQSSGRKLFTTDKSVLPRYSITLVLHCKQIFK